MPTIKKIELKFSGKIAHSKFIPDNPHAFINHIQAYDGKEVNVTVKRKQDYKKRSNQENRYYWGVIIKILCDEWGFHWHVEEDRMRVHSMVKEQFLVEPIEVKGKILKEEVSTAALSISEFEALMSAIREWASVEFNIYIPVPNEVPFEY